MGDNNLKEITLSLMPKEASDHSFILKELKKKDKLIKSFKIIRKSIDARKKT